MSFMKKVISMMLVVTVLVTGGFNLSTLAFDKNNVDASSVSSKQKDSDYLKAKKDLKKIEKELKRNRSKIKRDLDYSERNSTNNPQVSTRAAVVAVPVVRQGDGSLDAK